MKTKEQIIEWLKGQEWYNEFCVNALFRDEGILEDYIQSMMHNTQYIVSTAFVWPESEYYLWDNRDKDYRKWLNTEDEKPEEATEIKESKAEDRWIFDRGSKEAPFYMVYTEGQSAPTYKHGSMEEATKEADRLAKLLNTKTYVLAAVMEIRPKVVTSAVGIYDMEHQLDNPF